MNLAEHIGLCAEQKSEYKEADSSNNNDSGYTCTERIHENEDGKQEEQDSADCHPCAAAYPEGLEVSSESNDHEAMVHHPYSQHDREQDHSYSGIEAEEDTEKKVQDTSSNDIAPHRKVVTACGGYDELGSTNNQHENAEEYAESHVALHRKDEHQDTGHDTEQTGNKQKPPMLYSTGSF